MKLAVFINGFMPGTPERLKAMIECLESAGHSVDTGDVVAVLAANGEELPELPSCVRVMRVAVKNAPEAGRPLPYLRDVLDAGAAVLDCDVFCYLNSDLLIDKADVRLLKSGVAKAYVLKSHEIDPCSFEDFERRCFLIDVDPRSGFDAVAFDRSWWREGGRRNFPEKFILGEWRWDSAYDAIVRSLPQGLSACGTYHRKHRSGWSSVSNGGSWTAKIWRNMGPKVIPPQEETEALPEVIVSGSPDLVPVWCEAWARSGNRNPVRFFADSTWGAEAWTACGRVGTVEDATAIYADVIRRMKPGAPQFKIGWMAKAEIMRQARSEWAVWIDHDVEVQGDIGPIVQYAMENAEWFASPVYESFCDEDLGKHVAQHGIIVYKPGHEKMKRWADYVPTQSDPNDEHNFMTCFGGYEAARREVLDLYRPEWYESRQTGEMPVRLEEAVPRLENSKATLVHWTSRELKAPMIRHLKSVESERTKLVRAEFRAVEAKTRDVVFVLGTGSKFNNAEMRYALRSIEKYCPWVRQVWVVGADPGFLNTAFVKYVPAADVHTHCKDANLIHKIETVCRMPELSEEFLVCSDDQIVTYSSSWEDFRPRYVKRWSEADAAWYEADSWKRNLRETLRRFGDGAYYIQPHMWSQMKKSLFLEMLKMCNYKDEKSVTIFSLYGNFALQQGASAPVENFEHEFCVGGELKPVRHVAYNDAAFGMPEFRDKLGELFPVICKYERGT